MQVLQTILNTLQNGESASLDELSETLHLSSETLRAAMEQLEHMGRIRRTDSPPAGRAHAHLCAGCSGCAPGSGSSRNPGVRWELVRTVR